MIPAPAPGAKMPLKNKTNNARYGNGTVIHTALPALSAPLLTQEKHSAHVSVSPSTSHQFIGPRPFRAKAAIAPDSSTSSDRPCDDTAVPSASHRARTSSTKNAAALPSLHGIVGCHVAARKHHAHARTAQ